VFDRGKVYVKAVECEPIVVPGGFVINLAESNKIVFLNPSAATVFVLCDGERSVSRIAKYLQDIFKLEENPSAELASCIETLLAEGLIKLGDNSQKSVFKKIKGYLSSAKSV
jgi:hypothetical protein